MNWNYKSYNELTTAELYAVLQLRNAVFIVEQNCPYQDLDDKDQKSWHLMGWKGDHLTAYTRIIPPGISYDEASIGRVVTATASRRTGAGRELMRLSIQYCFDQFNTRAIRIGAQAYLQQFYESLGFTVTGEPYLEDGIPHKEMLLVK